MLVEADAWLSSSPQPLTNSSGLAAEQRELATLLDASLKPLNSEELQTLLDASPKAHVQAHQSMYLAEFHISRILPL